MRFLIQCLKKGTPVSDTLDSNHKKKCTSENFLSGYVDKTFFSPAFFC